jgi:hypothetical protein
MVLVKTLQTKALIQNPPGNPGERRADMRVRKKPQRGTKEAKTGEATMASGQLYRERAFPGAPALTETEFWRAVDTRDVHRIHCDRSHMCGENAVWASRSAMPCIYVCDYHRRVFEATGTFWKDGGAA